MVGRHISRPDVLRLAEALGVKWNGLDTMPELFGKCIERARRLERQCRLAKSFDCTPLIDITD